MPPASFRFHLTMNTLALGYVIPAIRVYSGLAPVRQCSCRAYTKKAAKLRDESCGTMLFMLVKGNNIKVFPTLKLPKRYQYEGMEREKTTQNLVFALFSHVEMIRCETLVACFTLADTIQNLLENHEVFKIAVFSHCFPIKRKSSYDFVVTA